MEHRILLVLLCIVSTDQAVFRTQEYTALELGQNITGKVVDISTANLMDCIRRCLLDGLCVACATTRDQRYVIIQRRGTAQEKQTLVSTESAAIFTANYTWNYTEAIESPLSSWNGPPVTLYFSFDALTGLGLMASSVPGKVNQAIAIDSSLNQSVDLGNLSVACITLPDTCGPEGAAVAVWVKIHSCPDGAGFLSSYDPHKTGFVFHCVDDNSRIRYYLAVENRKFSTRVTKIMNQWLHLVLNLIGPDSGGGIQAFKDGNLISSNQNGLTGTETMGTGRVVVGRKCVNIDSYYSHVEVDELIFFNQALIDQEVMDLYNLYQ